MTPVIQQSASFRAAPAALYELFLDSAKHTAATGAPAKISRKIGGKWSAFGGMILGKTIDIVPNRMIVQTWRSAAWKKADPDSILVVRFEKGAGGKATVHLTHMGVPVYDQQGVRKGWKKYYWNSWKKYFAARKRK